MHHTCAVSSRLFVWSWSSCSGCIVSSSLPLGFGKDPSLLDSDHVRLSSLPPSSLRTHWDGSILYQTVGFLFDDGWRCVRTRRSRGSFFHPSLPPVEGQDRSLSPVGPHTHPRGGGVEGGDVRDTPPTERHTETGRGGSKGEEKEATTHGTWTEPSKPTSHKSGKRSSSAAEAIHGNDKVDMEGELTEHMHGKSRVRVARVWREPSGAQYICEWEVQAILLSAMEHAFLHGDNAGMTPTDTVKNTVYYVAKKMKQRCTAEEFAIEIAKHFVKEYPLVSQATVDVEQKPWKRMQVMGRPHNHGFTMGGTELRTAQAVFNNSGLVKLSAGVKDFMVLKTTQSGYVGYLIDKFTTLGETTERLLGTSITASWAYSTPPRDTEKAYKNALDSLIEVFYGNPATGIYSPSVQYTLHEMSQEALRRVPEMESITMRLPNIHFLPYNHEKSGVKFEDDVYIATSEPHGTIQATVTRRRARL